MATETEIKLSLSPRAATRFAALPLLSRITPLRQRLLNTYYDTPDQQLQRERVAVRYRKKGREWLFTVKCAAPSVGGLAQRSEWEVAGKPGDFDFSHVDDSKLRRRLESWKPDLTAAFTTDFTRTAWIIEPQAGVRIEVALDKGWIEAQGRRQPICEVELELLEGDAAALFALAAELQAGLEGQFALHPESVSKAERGYRLFANTTPDARRSSPVALDRNTTCLIAFRTIAFACLGQLQGNERGVLDSDNPEFVHQARVAIRRLRSAIRAWTPLLPDSFTDSFDAQWRAVANALGDARDWDVFLTETLPPLQASFPGHPELDRLARQAFKQRTNSSKAARAAMQSVAYSRLLLDFTASTLALPERSEPPLKRHARSRLNKQAKKIARFAAKCVAPKADASHRHRLRVELKRLRYVLEYFSPLFPGRRLRSYLLSVAHLQDVLGKLNDLDFASSVFGKRGCTVDAWIGGQTDLLKRQFEKSLASFLAETTPWKKR